MEELYYHATKDTSGNEKCKVLRNVNVLNIHRDYVTEAWRGDIVVAQKRESACIIDAAVPGDNRPHCREQEKAQKYQDLKREIVSECEIRREEKLKWFREFWCIRMCRQVSWQGIRKVKITIRIILFAKRPIYLETVWYSVAKSGSEAQGKRTACLLTLVYTF